MVIYAYEATKIFPKEEMYGLTAQIRKSAISVPSNIVEGCARDTQADYVRFLYMAFGSLRELRYQFNLSKRLGYLKDDVFLNIETKVLETEKVLNSLIKALRKT